MKKPSVGEGWYSLTDGGCNRAAILNTMAPGFRMGLTVGCDKFAAANAVTPNEQQEWCACAPLVTPYETLGFNNCVTVRF